MLERPPKKHLFHTTRTPKKDIMGAINVNVSIGEN